MSFVDLNYEAAHLSEMRKFRLFPFRSPLLREFFLVYTPPLTEMFYFSGFAALLSSEIKSQNVNLKIYEV